MRRVRIPEHLSIYTNDGIVHKNASRKINLLISTQEKPKVKSKQNATFYRVNRSSADDSLNQPFFQE